MIPSIDETMMAIAHALSARSTCIKANAGCVLTDSHGRILGTGYNGVGRGMPHCNQREAQNSLTYDQQKKLHYASAYSAGLMQQSIAVPEAFPNKCEGVTAEPGGERCQAVHAETNALLICSNVDAIHSVYTTAEPCFRCTKELLNTGAQRIIAGARYGPEPQAQALWQRAGREWLVLQAESSA